MNNKEFAYNLYNMNIGDRKVDKYQTSLIERVPGGWIYHNRGLSGAITSSVFFPFDNEFQKYANKPTTKTITLLCTSCQESRLFKQKEKYQVTTYKCSYCGKEIEYQGE